MEEPLEAVLLPRVGVAEVASAAVAVGLGCATAASAADGRGVTSLVHMAATDPLAALVPRSFAFVPSAAHYDGVYYYAIARDPLARGAPHRLIDLAAYRYGHPGYGWLAWIASGGGQRAAVPYALVVVSLLGLGVAAMAASALARELGVSPWLGLSVGLNPGALLAVALDTSETVALAFVLLALLAWMRRRWLRAGAAIAVGCFTKEPFLLVPLALLVLDAYGVAAMRRLPVAPVRRLAALVTGPVLYVAWLGYCRHVFGAFPFDQSTQLAAPISGWIDTMHRAAGLVRTGDAQVGMMTPALLVAVGAVLVVGAFFAVRRRYPVDAAFVALTALVFCTNWYVLLYPKDLARLVVLPLALVPFVVGADLRARTDDGTG